MTLESAADLIGIDDTDIPEYGLTIIACLNPDGHQNYRYITHGEANVAQLVVLLAIVQHEILHRLPT